MVAVDGIHNGWRYIVLPLARTNSVLMHAVLAASASHFELNRKARNVNHPPMYEDRTESGARQLAIEQPNWLPQMLYSRAILGLRSCRVDSADASEIHNLLLTLLVLLVTVMITGGCDFPILSAMLQSAINIIGGDGALGNDQAAKFISRQYRK